MNQDRVVLSDDGTQLKLTFYLVEGTVAAVVLDPHRALILGGELIAAAHPKIRPPR
jgi:hypothetical protein